jgi:hypothetical protein
LPRPAIDAVRDILHGKQVVHVDDAFEIERSRPHGHVAAVLGTLRKLKLDWLLDRKRSRPRDLVTAMIAARVLDPRSKLATARSLHPETLQHTLAECLDVQAADTDELYGAMDWLLERQGKVEKSLAKKHLGDSTLILYDLTSVYFEGRTCPLAKIGYSRDGKKNRPQVVVGLLTNPEGCPIGVEVYKGNTADPATVESQVKRIKERFGLQRVVLVGDRGTLTSARIKEDVAPNNLEWITALRSPQIRKLVQSRCIQLSLFDKRDLAEIHHPEFPGERLVVCRNPLLARERKRKREALLQATEENLAKITAAVERPCRPLRGKDKIGVRLGRVLAKSKVGKHFKTTIGEDSFHWERDTAKIEEEMLLDGLYVIRTNVPEEVMDSERVVESYKGLSVVERAFRSLKTIDLKIRPVHHRLADRVRAHVFLCMLAYYVEWHMRRKLASLLFDDDDPKGKRERRQSIVAPAKRSKKAERKASTQKTQDGWPVHSFQSLLKDLGTLCRNRVALKSAREPFDLLTTPTPLQQRAFDLLDVEPSKVK